MRISTVLLFLTISIQGFGQTPTSIATDRPGQAFNALTVGKQVLQFQLGTGFFSTSPSDAFLMGDGSYENSLFLGEASIRYGLTDNFEINTTWAYSQVEQVTVRQTFIPADPIQTEQESSGISSSQIAVRYNIVRENRWMPSIAIQTSIDIDAKSEDFKGDGAQPAILIATSQQLIGNLALATNLSAIWKSNGFASVTYGYVANLSYSLGSKWGIFLENFGTYDDTLFGNDFNTNFDGGVSFQVNNDLVLDLFAGYSNNDNLQQTFVATGFSWRIGKTKGVSQGL